MKNRWPLEMAGDILWKQPVTSGIGKIEIGLLTSCDQVIGYAVIKVEDISWEKFCSNTSHTH
jgi:hypothetical protein